jgi:hypothetical protein
MKKLALAFGLAATAALVVLAPLAGASGSGDSSLDGQYKQPNVPAATVGSTITQAPTLAIETADSTLSVPSAAPTLKAGA